MKRFAHWQSLLKDAKDERGIVLVVQEFLSSIDRDEHANLPAGCCPLAVDSAREISEWAVELARADREFVDQPKSEVMLHEMSAVFTEAANCLAELATEARLFKPSGQGDTRPPSGAG